MKQKFLAAFAIVAIAAVAVANKLNTDQNQMSELMLANVEALSQGEVVDVPCEAAVNTCEFTVVMSDGRTFPGKMDYARNTN